MDQTYNEWYEFDVNVVRILITTCAYKSTNIIVSTNKSKFVVKFQYCWHTYTQNLMSAYE